MKVNAIFYANIHEIHSYVYFTIRKFANEREFMEIEYEKKIILC